MDKLSRLNILKKAELTPEIVPSSARLAVGNKLLRKALLVSLPLATYGGYKAFTGAGDWLADRRIRKMIEEQQAQRQQ